jgi:hypothetical protein
MLNALYVAPFCSGAGRQAEARFCDVRVGAPPVCCTLENNIKAGRAKEGKGLGGEARVVGVGGGGGLRGGVEVVGEKGAEGGKGVAGVDRVEVGGLPLCSTPVDIVTRAYTPEIVLRRDGMLNGSLSPGQVWL